MIYILPSDNNSVIKPVFPQHTANICQRMQEVPVGPFAGTYISLYTTHTCFESYMKYMCFFANAFTVIVIYTGESGSLRIQETQTPYCTESFPRKTKRFYDKTVKVHEKLYALFTTKAHWCQKYHTQKTKFVSTSYTAIGVFRFVLSWGLQINTDEALNDYVTKKY